METFAGKFFPHLGPGGKGAMVLITDGGPGGSLTPFISARAGDRAMYDFVPTTPPTLNIHPPIRPADGNPGVNATKGDWQLQMDFLPNRAGSVVAVSYSQFTGQKVWSARYKELCGAYTHTVYRLKPSDEVKDRRDHKETDQRGVKTDDASAGAAPSWLNFRHEGAWVAGRGYESTPMFFGGKLYLMQSMMGHFAPDGGPHSYFCIFDGETGEEVACPESSSGHAACSGIVDRASVPGRERAYVFCSAWDRANHTSCPPPPAGAFTWGCGACSRPGGCYVGAWSSGDMRSWEGPSMAVPPEQIARLRKPAYGSVSHNNFHPPKLQLPTNVAVAPVPRSSAAPIAGVPLHQAFMAFELSYNIAVNVGTDGDLTKNWLVLDPSKFGGQDIECPTVRYRAADKYYYLFGDIESVGQIFIKRTKNLTVGSWESPAAPTIPVMESGCINRTEAHSYGGRYRDLLAPSEDCSPGQPMTKIAEGKYTNYWKNNSDRGGREFLSNLTAWQWSVNDPDFCDHGGEAPTYFIYGMCAQTHAANWTGKVNGFYQLGIYNGTDVDFLASYFESSADEKVKMKTE
jgi:hypothetical protein